MTLFLLTLLINPAHAETCSLRDLTINQPRLIEYAAASGELKKPRLLRTEPNPAFDPDFPTTYWALPTAGNIAIIKIHHATMAPSGADTAIGVVWVDTVLIIDPATKTVSGTEECEVLHPATEHVLGILGVIQEPGAPR